MLAGGLFTGCWYLILHSGEKGEPMLMPGQSQSIKVVEQVKTGAAIFLCTSVAVALLAFYRPSSKE
jgi:hypothetical protein